MLITIHKLTWKYIWSSLFSYTNDINIGLILVFITLKGPSRIFISEHKEFSHVVLHFHAFFKAVWRPQHGHDMTCWTIIYWETLSTVNLSLVLIKQKIKPMKSYGMFCYLCAPENPGFHGGEKYSFKQWRSNSHKCMIYDFLRGKQCSCRKQTCSKSFRRFVQSLLEQFSKILLHCTLGMQGKAGH